MPTMLAGVSSESGIAIRQVPRPVPLDEQVLVKVAAAGMNRADLNAAKGAGVATKDSLGKPIGMEWAGEVVAVGSKVSDLRPGDKVMASGSGGYAQYAVSDQGRTHKIDGLDLEKAAALPLVLMTAHDAVVTNGRFKSGESILVQGASSAVGLMAMQIARLIGAANIFGSSSNSDRRARLAEFGATHAIDPASADWPKVVLDQTGQKGVELVVDMVSGPSVNQSMQAAAVRGRVVNVGRLGGVRAEFDFDLHAANRLEYVGVTFRTRSPAEVRAIARRMQEDLWEPLTAGRIGLPIDRSFSLSDAAKAHAHMAANAHFGKIVLIP